MNNAIAESLLKRTAAYIPGIDIEGAASPVNEKPWQRWLEAELGLRNHWYPVEPSRNIREGEHKAVKILGEEILLLRRQGKLHALEDRCAHRGSRLSKRPLTYTDDTITCWHHTFTFNLDDGRIRCLLNDPGSSLCGRKGLKIYQVCEAKGVIFIFIGDIAAPPLSCDVPPGFLDDDMAICVADPYIVNANWRLGSEGGFDPGHHFIHNWSKFAINARLPMTFGWVPNKSVILETNLYQDDAEQPKGFTRIVAGEDGVDVNSTLATIPGRNGSEDFTLELPISRGHTAGEKQAYQQAAYEGTVGAWLPCSLKVDPWPYPGVIHNEYYVPRDADSHHYFQCGWLRTDNDKEREDWESGELGEVRWRMPVVEEFTIDDAFAREGTHAFYSKEEGWKNEQLAAFDIELLMWRTFCSDHARGIQRPEHTRGQFKR